MYLMACPAGGGGSLWVGSAFAGGGGFGATPAAAGEGDVGGGCFGTGSPHDDAAVYTGEPVFADPSVVS